MIRSWVIVAALAALVAGLVVAKTAFLPPKTNPAVEAKGLGLSTPPPPEGQRGPVMAESGIPKETLDATKLADSLGNGRPTLVDFGAGTCDQCKKEAPLLDAAVEKYRGKANVVFVDTNSFESVAKQYGVRLIPTQIFFDAKGKEVSRHIGFHPAEALTADLATAGVK